MIVEAFALIQRKAIDLKSERLQKMADSMYGQLDPNMIKALLMQHQANQHVDPSPMQQMIASRLARTR